MLGSIVGKWLTPETIARNVKTYIKNKQAPKPLSDQINLLLKNSLTTDRDFIIDGEVSEILVPAEFFEVLTAIKMSVLLRNNEVELKKVLKFLDTSKRINYKFSQASPLKINIPVKSNFPLTDYEISFKPDNYDETIKVSVKSKVKSDNTNTLKLDQVFDTVAVLTQGRNQSEVLLYDIYLEAFTYSNMGYAAVLTLSFLAVIVGLSTWQAKYIDRKVHYT